MAIYAIGGLRLALLRAIDCKLLPRGGKPLRKSGLNFPHMTKKLRGITNLFRATPRPAVAGRILAIGQGTEINLVVLDLSRLVVGMRKELRDLLREDISFDISLLATGRCLVSADRHQMRELVIHLVLDARDAMPHGGSLNIAIEKKRIDEAMSLYRDSTVEHVVVAVRNSPTEGAPDMAERLDFGVVKGRGLSLAASYDAINRGGGHISVSRRAGETLVQIYLPCRDRRDPLKQLSAARRGSPTVTGRPIA